MNPRTKSLTLDILNYQYDELERLSRELKMTKQRIITEAIADWLKKVNAKLA